MIKNGKYRFTLQFGMTTDEEQRAGELLEQLGKKKSPIVVAALNEYMAAHPDILAGKGDIQLHISSPDPKQLEDTVRRLVTEMLGAGIIRDGIPPSTSADTAKQVSDDILDMLSDLDMFG